MTSYVDRVTTQSETRDAVLHMTHNICRDCRLDIIVRIEIGILDARKYIGPSCGNIGLFRGKIGILDGNIRLFDGNVGLFNRNTGLVFQKSRDLWRESRALLLYITYTYICTKQSVCVSVHIYAYKTVYVSVYVHIQI